MNSENPPKLDPPSRSAELADFAGRRPLMSCSLLQVSLPVSKNQSGFNQSGIFVLTLTCCPACADGSSQVRSTAAFPMQGAFATRKTAATPLPKRSRSAPISTAQALPSCILDTLARRVLAGRGARPW
jgi:hypothetical protein